MENEKIGALWLNTSKAGNKYLQGAIDTEQGKIKIIIFKNNKKKKDKHPDYVIFRSEDNNGK